MKYFDIYRQRLNRFGDNNKDRINNQRERSFAIFVERSPSKIDFIFGGDTNKGVLKENRQDDKKISFYLLTSVDLEIPGGTILTIDNNRWIVTRKEFKEGKGYNSYIVFKITNSFTINGTTYYGSVFGPVSTFIADLFSYTNASASLARENYKHFHLIMPNLSSLKKDQYLVIGTEGFTVSGYDSITVPGVMYVSLEQTYLKDQTPAPVKTPDDDPDEFFWLKGE